MRITYSHIIGERTGRILSPCFTASQKDATSPTTEVFYCAWSRERELCREGKKTPG